MWNSYFFGKCPHDWRMAGTTQLAILLLSAIGDTVVCVNDKMLVHIP